MSSSSATARASRAAPGAELVVGGAGFGIEERAVELPRLGPEHEAGGRGVALEALVAARVRPGLRANAVAGPDRDLLVQTIVEQLGVGVIGPPSVGDAVALAGSVDHEQARLEPAAAEGLRLVVGELEMLDEDRAGGKRPFAVARELDRLASGQRDPPSLQSAVGPERAVHGVGDDAGRWRHVVEAGEEARFRELFRQPPGVEPDLEALDRRAVVEAVGLRSDDLVVRAGSAGRRACRRGRRERRWSWSA